MKIKPCKINEVIFSIIISTDSVEIMKSNNFAAAKGVLKYL